MLTLPEAVRETLPADLLQTNGYFHIAALHTVRLIDLEEMGVLRGHARMIMSVLRPGGDPPVTPSASPRNETSTDAPKPAARYVRCRSFLVTTSGSAPARRAWRAFMLAFGVVLRTIGVPSPVPILCSVPVFTPRMHNYASVDADVSGLVWDALLSVEGGLPDDVLLSIPEGIMLTRDGVAAVARILRFMKTKLCEQSEQKENC